MNAVDFSNNQKCINMEHETTKIDKGCKQNEFLNHIEREQEEFLNYIKNNVLSRSYSIQDVCSYNQSWVTHILSIYRHPRTSDTCRAIVIEFKPDQIEEGRNLYNSLKSFPKYTTICFDQGRHEYSRELTVKPKYEQAYNKFLNDKEQIEKQLNQLNNHVKCETNKLSSEYDIYLKGSNIECSVKPNPNWFHHKIIKENSSHVIIQIPYHSKIAKLVNE